MTERNISYLRGFAKAASGTLDCLPLWKMTNLARALDDLKENGFWTVGLDEKANIPLKKADLPLLEVRLSVSVLLLENVVLFLQMGFRCLMNILNSILRFHVW